MSSQALVKDDHVASDEAPLTLEALRGAMPKRQKSNVNQKLVDRVNNLVSDPEARNVFRENVVGYAGILSDPNVKITTYLDAVRYVSYKLMGYTNQESWIKTFPDRYARLQKQKRDSGFIRATVSCYHRNKVVATILEQSMIPTWVVNADLYQRAINTQAELMITAKSEKVRTDAANSLLTHLKQPESNKLTLDVNVQQDDSLRDLNRATFELITAQKKAIEAGANNAEDIAKSRLIDAEVVRID